MTNTTTVGRQAETKAVQYLQSLGYEIIGRNVRTRWYEIDIIALGENEIIFVEVKFRHNADFGDGAEAITTDKQKRLTQATQSWLAQHQEFSALQPRIDVIVITQSRNTLKHYQSVIGDNS